MFFFVSPLLSNIFLKYIFTEKETVIASYFYSILNLFYSFFFLTDQLTYLNSDGINDELLEEIFGGETLENGCIFQNEAADEGQAVLWDFDCSVFEYKPAVDENSNNDCSRDPETQVSVEICKDR